MKKKLTKKQIKNASDILISWKKKMPYYYGTAIIIVFLIPWMLSTSACLWSRSPEDSCRLSNREMVWIIYYPKLKRTSILYQAGRTNESCTPECNYLCVC